MCLLWNLDVCTVWTRWCFSMRYMSLQGPSCIQTWREGAVKMENSCKFSPFFSSSFSIYVSTGYLTLNECTGYSSWELSCGWHLRGWKGYAPVVLSLWIYTSISLSDWNLCHMLGFGKAYHQWNSHVAELILVCKVVLRSLTKSRPDREKHCLVSHLWLPSMLIYKIFQSAKFFAPSLWLQFVNFGCP